jgi:hypothetical protein
MGLAQLNQLEARGAQVLNQLHHTLPKVEFTRQTPNP